MTRTFLRTNREPVGKLRLGSSRRRQDLLDLLDQLIPKTEYVDHGHTGSIERRPALDRSRYSRAMRKTPGMRR